MFNKIDSRHRVCTKENKNLWVLQGITHQMERHSVHSTEIPALGVTTNALASAIAYTVNRRAKLEELTWDL